MKLSIISIFILLISHMISANSQPRIVIMTDFPLVDVIPGGMGFGSPKKCSDSDDAQPMVRFLLYTNEFDVDSVSGEGHQI